MTPSQLLAGGALTAALLAAGILVWQLIYKPPLDRRTIVLLLLGLGVLPITTAAAGNMLGFERTTHVEFCSTCHVMQPWIADVRGEPSESLAAFHARNRHFGNEACYVCHADYGMYGAVETKLTGTKHVWKYYTGYRSMPVEEAVAKIELYKPFPNSTCMECHSTTLPGWNDEPEHAAVVEDVRGGTISCASEGCHGPAHGVGAPAEAAAKTEDPS